jgi:hypothetical protein
MHVKLKVLETVYQSTLYQRLMIFTTCVSHKSGVRWQEVLPHHSPCLSLWQIVHMTLCVGLAKNKKNCSLNIFFSTFQKFK